MKTDKKLLYAVVISCVAVLVVFAIIIAGIMIAKKIRPEKTEETEEVTTDDKSVLDEFDKFAGVWIASVFNIDFPSQKDLSAEALRAELDSIVDNAADAGLNTIFFQVRPEADALYKSEIFPVSRYISSSGVLEIDTLEYIIEKAHEKGIAVHAWVNPLRVSSSATVTLETLPDDHPAKKNPDWVVSYADGKMYFNAGLPEVRDLVVRGVREIVENYAVDGIVFDDYFYPYPVYETLADGSRQTAVFDDAVAYETYAGDKALDAWRRDNINKLIADVYNTVKGTSEKCLFGVSPFGIWKNGYGDESGSLTTGSESYSMLYCDSLAWVREGYIDYIAPQLYWRNSDSAAPFNVLCDWWNSMVEGTGVRLLISHGAYRYENDWQDPSGIITEQVEYAREMENYRGSIYYGYYEVRSNLEGLKDELKELYK